MKKENFSSKIRKAFLLVAAMLTVFTASAETINCDDIDCIKDAMANAQPGDEIVIASGNYAASNKVKYENEGVRIFAYFVARKNGNTSNPITLRGASSKNKPVLTSTASGEMFLLAGDHWIIKDLEIKNGKRCILTDLADNNQLINLTVSGSESEAIHFRNNSNNNLLKNCTIFNVGAVKPGNGEAIYIGSSKNQHSQYSPKSDNNIIEGCTIGPDVRAEGVDIKEGTSGTIVRNSTFSGKGISGENSGDAFIDAKGIDTFIYGNTFNRDGSNIIASGIDFLDRGVDNSGYRNAIFDNDFNFGDKTTIPSARRKQGTPSEIHFWGNRRDSSSPHFHEGDPDYPGTIAAIVPSCPEWNIIACSTLSTSEFNQLDSVTLYPNPVQERFYVSGIPNNAPVSVAIMTLQGQIVSRSENVLLGTQGVDVTNLAQGMYIIKIKSEVIEGSIMASIN